VGFSFLQGPEERIIARTTRLALLVTLRANPDLNTR